MWNQVILGRGRGGKRNWREEDLPASLPPGHELVVYNGDRAFLVAARGLYDRQIARPAGYGYSCWWDVLPEERAKFVCGLHQTSTGSLFQIYDLETFKAKCAAVRQKERADARRS